MKKTILGVAVIALMAACSTNEVIDTGHNAGTIGLGASTSRAEIATVDDLKQTPNGSVGGFTVWATSAAAADLWYADGDAHAINGIRHSYGANEAGVWDFDPQVKWPATGYPMNFYGIYPNPVAPGAVAASGTGLVPGLNLAIDQTTQKVTGTFTVQALAADQIDLLGAKATANIRPATDNLSMTFRHLLSKINFTMTVSDDYRVHVQGLAVNNVGNQGTYTFTGTPGWTTVPSTYTADYLYRGMIYADGSNTGNASILSESTYGYNTGDANDLADATNKSLMLMPQPDVTAQTWTPSAGNGPGAATYISMVYRMNYGDEDLVGYTDATKHQKYPGSALEASGYGDNPLYVKVGFPFTLDWDMQKGYTYNLIMPGTTGGLLIDQYYYDNKGNRTDLIVGDFDGDGLPGPGPIVPEPVLGGDEYIHLIPIVSEWTDQSATDINPADPGI